MAADASGAGGKLTLKNANLVCTGGTGGAAAQGDILIEGGTVNATGGLSGITAVKNMSITSGDVTARGTGAESIGITAAEKLDVSGGTVNAAGVAVGMFGKEVKLSGGSVTAVGAASGIFGTEVKISAAAVEAGASGAGGLALAGEEKLSISSGTVTATAGGAESAAIAAMNQLSISGGTVTAAATGADSIGIASAKQLSISGTSTRVTADGTAGAVNSEDETISIAEALMIKEPAGGVLSADKKDICQADGTTVSTHALIVPRVTPTVTVSFNANGHGSAPDAQTVAVGGTVTRPPDPAETGWSFGGWYLEAACTNAFDFSTPVGASLTLYAKWTQIPTPVPAHYTITKGANGTWTKGSSTGHELIVKRSVDDAHCIDYFDSLQINGQTLTQGTDYTVAPGSTVITLKPSYLEKLSNDEHDVRVRFDDGTVDTKLTIRPARKGVATGDENHPGVWLALLALSGFGVLAVSQPLWSGKRRDTGKHCA